jgi:putative transposase
VRRQAARLFEQDVSAVRVAHRLRVSTKSACQWRLRWARRWRDRAGVERPGGAVCRLDDRQVARVPPGPPGSTGQHP